MTELLNFEIYRFLALFLRLGSAFMLMPGFMTSYVNMRLRLSIALALCFILMPVIGPELPSPPTETARLFLFILSEITVGVFLGIMMQFLYTALALAGNFAGQAIGFANAQIFDPNFQSQSMIMETFLSIIALTLIFMTDLHHLMLSALVDSYRLFPAGETLPLGDFANHLSDKLNQSFIMGFKIGSPFIAFTIVFYVGMGLVSRLMPQLNIFFLSLPLQIYLGLGLLMLVCPMMLLWFMQYYESGLQQLLR